MARIHVLKEILTWSKNRPGWQRDALRLLVTRGELSTTDIAELTNLCRSAFGLGDGSKPVPLDATHLPHSSQAQAPVSLHSITHHTGVNALAREQTISFGGQLTVVFGANAAGKSGYTRILKRACRTRGAEEILGNVIAANGAPARPSATIRLKAAEKIVPHVWDDDEPSQSPLSQISVFDRHCAAVYLAKPTDVAFRPLGLDLFDKLSSACAAVKKLLERDRNAIASHRFSFPAVAPGTTVHETVTRLTSLTNPAAVEELASLTSSEKSEIQALRCRLRDLRSTNPSRAARTLDLRAERLRALRVALDDACTSLSDLAITDLFRSRAAKDHADLAVTHLHHTTFKQQPLKSTGSAAWRALWSAAERFSVKDAYPNRPFPATDPDTRCVLCQQTLDASASTRFSVFRSFLDSETQETQDRAEAEYQKRLAQVQGVNPDTLVPSSTVEELSLDRQDIASSVRTCLDVLRRRQNAVIEALESGMLRAPDLPELSPDTRSLSAYDQDLRDRAGTLRSERRDELIQNLQATLDALEARETLAANIDAVNQEIERKKRIAAYQLCIDETRTNAITKKSSEVTRKAVTEQLKSGFAKELRELEFRHVEVELVDAGGSRGVLYHKLQLRRAPGTEVTRVVSEGEARCLSLAAFFAELHTESAESTILFDDPISSMDHDWRDAVAKRLVVAATSRQVVVFTHDIVFLYELMEKAEALSVNVHHQYVRRGSDAAGLSSEELPWIAQGVVDRLKHMEDLWLDANTTHKSRDEVEYERKTRDIYGHLREAWERGCEEVLMAGVVGRYKPTIETKKTRYLTDIGERDLQELSLGMSKCSKWLRGHDTPRAAQGPVPRPDEVKEDIAKLRAWAKGINKRRS